MDWLQFISSVVAALAWPLVAVVLAYMLRGPIKSLVPFLHKMRYKDFEMEFRRKLAEAEEEIEQTRLEPRDVAPHEETILELAQVSPRAAVTEAWRQVELAILDTAKRLLGHDFNNRTATFNTIRKLERDERMDRGAIAMMRDLRRLRNDAVHSPEFALSAGSALEYADAARSLVSYLRAGPAPDDRSPG